LKGQCILFLQIGGQRENNVNKEEIINHALSFEIGGMSEKELCYVYDVCTDKTVLELGSMAGMSGYVIASVAKSLSCVDLWSANLKHLEHDSVQQKVYRYYEKELPLMFDIFKKNCKEFIELGKINIYRGNTNKMFNSFVDKTFDIILFDADHSYEGVSRDFGFYRDKVKDDGFIVFHDYGDSMWTGVTTFVNEMVETSQIEIVAKVERIGVFRKL